MHEQIENVVYQFNGFRVDAVKRQLWHDGKTVPLTSKSFDTLLFLLRNSGLTVTKTELMRADNALAIVVTDFNTGAAISKDTFPPPQPHNPSAPTFDSLQACIDDFNCKHRGELLCEANRTCKDQFAALTCCLKSGQCFSVHLIIRPTRPLCQLINSAVNFEGFVLEQAKTQ